MEGLGPKWRGDGVLCPWPFGLNRPGYVPWSNMADFSDLELIAALRVFQRSKGDVTWTELGTDPLAMTRGNASAILNMSPVHSRAGQLALIRRRITIQDSLLERLAAYPRIVRILKARVVTDIVSLRLSRNACGGTGSTTGDGGAG